MAGPKETGGGPKKLHIHLGAVQTLSTVKRTNRPPQAFLVGDGGNQPAQGKGQYHLRRINKKPGQKILLCAYELFKIHAQVARKTFEQSRCKNSRNAPVWVIWRAANACIRPDNQHHYNEECVCVCVSERLQQKRIVKTRETKRRPGCTGKTSSHSNVGSVRETHNGQRFGREDRERPGVH